MPVPLEKFSKGIIQRVFFVLNCKCKNRQVELVGSEPGGTLPILRWTLTCYADRLSPRSLPVVGLGGGLCIIRAILQFHQIVLLRIRLGPVDPKTLTHREWPVTQSFLFFLWRWLKFASFVLLWDDVSDLILWKVAWLIIILVRGWVAPSFLTWRVWRRRRWTIWWTTPWAE